MKFNRLVAVIAIATLAVQANAYSDGSLRRNVAQNDTIQSQPSEGVVGTAIQQPVTVVEAAPVNESRAELMRKARQGEEVKTEQKIVEKLEESRLREEQQRAERLFGDRLETTPTAAPVVAPVVTPTPAPAPVAAPAPTQVTIEKVEIIQPAPIKEEKLEAAPAVSKMDLEEEAPEQNEDKFFVSGILAAPNYNASNVKSNYGLGFSVGRMLATGFVLEGTFLYSNHTIDTYWRAPLYSDLDQYDLSLSAKYHILSGPLKPFVGASVSYVYRKYQERAINNVYNSYWQINPTDTEESTNSVNAGLLAGVDYEISKNILLGIGADYNVNVMNKSDFQSRYGVPADIKPLEEIDYTVFKVNAKMTF